METISNMQVVSFTLGLLGIVASLLVLRGPSPVLDGIAGTPSQVGSNKTSLLHSSRSVDLTDSNKTSLQRLPCLDGGFSDTIRLTTVINIVAQTSLIYGAAQFNIVILRVAIIYQILTYVLGIYFLGIFWEVELYFGSHEFNLSIPMCLCPIESVPLLYAQSLMLASFVFIMRGILSIVLSVLGIILESNLENPAPQSSVNSV